MHYALFFERRNLNLIIIVFICLFADRVTLAKAGLELKTFLPQSPKYWGYRYAPPYPARILDKVKDALLIISAFHFCLLFLDILLRITEMGSFSGETITKTVDNLA